MWVWECLSVDVCVYGIYEYDIEIKEKRWVFAWKKNGAFYLYYVFNDYTSSKYVSKQNTLAGH